MTIYENLFVGRELEPGSAPSTAAPWPSRPARCSHLRCRGRREDPQLGTPVDRPGSNSSRSPKPHLGREGAPSRRADLGDPRPRVDDSTRSSAPSSSRAWPLYTMHRMAEIHVLADHASAARRPAGPGCSAGRDHAGWHRARDDRPGTGQPVPRGRGTGCPVPGRSSRARCHRRGVWASWASSTSSPSRSTTTWSASSWISAIRCVV